MSDFEIIERPEPGRRGGAVLGHGTRALIETAATGRALVFAGRTSSQLQGRFSVVLARHGFRLRTRQLDDGRVAIWAERRDGDRP